jgi:hypothetical protein
VIRFDAAGWSGGASVGALLVDIGDMVIAQSNDTDASGRGHLAPGSIRSPSVMASASGWVWSARHSSVGDVGETKFEAA